MKKFQEKYPYYTIKEDEASKTIYFQHDSETTYTPEELLAMFLEFAKEIASDFAGISKIKEKISSLHSLFFKPYLSPWSFSRIFLIRPSL